MFLVVGQTTPHELNLPERASSSQWRPQSHRRIRRQRCLTPSIRYEHPIDHLHLENCLLTHLATNSSSTRTRTPAHMCTPGGQSPLSCNLSTTSSTDPSLCRHFRRVVGYARPSDYIHGAVAAAFGPAALYAMEKVAPSWTHKRSFAAAMRLAGAIGVCGGFLYFYTRSSCMFLRLDSLHCDPNV